ncbi:MAG: TetR family transcriptional regulator, partial [Candidatus Aegiribacteria sp.]|nr:TetR family transcriptional regulator [Candidatus Aegiribacteria sp.]MBD3295325.1 TetR family transcriptional regulator [Candidatus Fermentibacteria bacterium]
MLTKWLNQIVNGGVITSAKVDEKAILEAAASVFAEKGWAGARVDAIASEAGLNKAMLYYRVGGKEELYRRVVLRAQEY